MKSTTTLALLIFSLACFGQPDSSWITSKGLGVTDNYYEMPNGYFDSLPVYLSEGRIVSMGTWLDRDYDCEPFESVTNWKVTEPAPFNNKCGAYYHIWVYAEWEDVNEISMTTTLMNPPPCGFDKTDNEARICRTCGMHQTRTKTKGWKEVKRQSEYKQLLKQFGK